MIFEFLITPGFDFLTAFAEKLGVSVIDDSLKIPASLGKGFVKKAELTSHITYIQHRYKLREELILRRLLPEPSSEYVDFLFNINQDPAIEAESTDILKNSKSSEFAIRIISPYLDSELVLPANKEAYFTVISISKVKLRQLIDVENPNSVVKTILENSMPFLFYESMSPEVQKTLKQLTNEESRDDLSNLYQKIKVEELIYLLFKRLLKRDTFRLRTINQADIEKIFNVKNGILTDLGKAPTLPVLARQAGLSQSKMTHIFKQVFGSSIYSYYQEARMEEASYLLKNGKAVSEVGYQLGFSNLSHFSRLFERHYGIKPKKYSVSNEAI